MLKLPKTSLQTSGFNDAVVRGKDNFSPLEETGVNGSVVLAASSPTDLTSLIDGLIDSSC